jgi:hypothetical protein
MMRNFCAGVLTLLLSATPVIAFADDTTSQTTNESPLPAAGAADPSTAQAEGQGTLDNGAAIALTVAAVATAAVIIAGSTSGSSTGTH